jgi:hypothetical protein
MQRPRTKTRTARAAFAAALAALTLASLILAGLAATKPVIFTYGHEFNVSGQYPWAARDTGSCGSLPCTPAQWIAAWDAVQA